jgi:hypothetical protein
VGVFFKKILEEKLDFMGFVRVGVNFEGYGVQFFKSLYILSWV